MRWRPGAIIDCENPTDGMKAILVDESSAFVDILKYTDHPYVWVPQRTLVSYAPKKGWSTYEWVGFWNYTVLVTATVLGCWILHLLRLL